MTKNNRSGQITISSMKQFPLSCIEACCVAGTGNPTVVRKQIRLRVMVSINETLTPAPSNVQAEQSRNVDMVEDASILDTVDKPLHRMKDSVAGINVVSPHP
jgi:hypothetical protein